MSQHTNALAVAAPASRVKSVDPWKKPRKFPKQNSNANAKISVYLVEATSAATTNHATTVAKSNALKSGSQRALVSARGKSSKRKPSRKKSSKPNGLSKSFAMHVPTIAGQQSQSHNSLSGLSNPNRGRWNRKKSLRAINRCRSCRITHRLRMQRRHPTIKTDKIAPAALGPKANSLARNYRTTFVDYRRVCVPSEVENPELSRTFRLTSIKRFLASLCAPP